MAIDRYRQQPADRRYRSVDYAPWLTDGETLTNVTSSVSPVTVPPLVVDGVTFDATATEVLYFAGGGVDGTTYEITFTITTSDGQIRQDEIEIEVEET